MSARLVNLDAKFSDMCPQQRTGWFATTVVVPVDGVDSATAAQRVAEARKRIAEDTALPPFNMHIEARHHSSAGRKGRTGRDSRPWRSEVSRHPHSTMGYYRVVPSSAGPSVGMTTMVNSELAQSKNAVVVQMVESPIVDAAINAVIAENPDMTVRQFMSLPEVQLAPAYMKQNCLRLAAQLGAALTADTPATVMKIESDINAVPEPGFAAPAHASASIVSVSNYFETKPLPLIVAGEATAGKTIFHDGSTDTIFAASHAQSLDLLNGLVVKGRPAAVSSNGASSVQAAIGAPMTAVVMREMPSENLSMQQFVANRGHEGARKDIQRRFTNAEGLAPSRVDKAFYSRDSLPNVCAPGDLRLEPVGVSINAKSSGKQ